jgi:hypothetical protein
MKTYTVYTTSEIRRTITTTEEGISLNVGQDEQYIEGDFTDDRYYVQGSEIKPYPAKPDYPCEFDRASGLWVWVEEKSWSLMRMERDRLLAASDWTQVPDAPVDRAAWATYRQALRDLPSNTTDPRNPAWPTPPA